MINIVIPMAGMGSRFQQEGYKKPKPFIDVAGKPMICRVIDNLYYPGATYYLIARKEHLEAEQELVKEIEANYNAKFIAIDKLTEGTACTVLFARSFINNDNPLLIANSDQIVDCDISIFIDDCLQQKRDGSILTFIDEELNPKWSFARLDGENKVVEVKEKKAISKYATVGIYLFSKGKTFVDGAIDMIINNDRVNNEFYTCPVYNYTIKEGSNISIFNIETSAMHGIGTPEDLNTYLLTL
jgi:UDP-N-acetylglucosamine diphosphorylase / glucose-1-phosphate thymidylyltransferase / UDP-N-acetylgalactosamine diphosphorylase / glucosamine-1-phosphate N-acetyltransferase / galactosamine-1-phosphate N-acetyltransferase